MSDSPQPPGKGGEPSTSRDADAVRPVIVGTVLAAVVLVVLLIARNSLEARDAQWWIGAAAVAVLLGLIGIALVTKRVKR